MAKEIYELVGLQAHQLTLANKIRKIKYTHDETSLYVRKSD